jgi:manganese/zinc/iron transport system substrate-binding protein
MANIGRMPRLRTFPVSLVAIIVLLLGASLTGCVDDEDASGAGDGRIRVVATTNIVADLARQVGGDDVEVVALMPPGVDPHQYKASAGDVRRLSEADLIVYGGLELEGKMGDVFAELGDRVPTVAVAEGLPEDRLIPVDGSPGRFDPHVWNDPELWGSAGVALGDALAEVDAANADAYRERAAAYADRLLTLRDELRRRLADVPEGSRVVVTSHDAFRYFGRAFGFEVAGIQGVSTATEATTADVDRIARLVAERRLRAIFVESSVPRQTVDAVLAAARSRGQTARVGGSLYSDSAGDEGTPEGTYEGMLRANVETIATGLTGGS